MLKIPRGITTLFFLYHSKVCLFFYFLLHLAHYIQAFLHYMHELITYAYCCLPKTQVCVSVHVALFCMP